MASGNGTTDGRGDQPGYNRAMSFPRGLGAVVMLLLLAGTLWGVTHRDPWDPDETRYLQVGREMLETGNPMFLTFNGEAYTHKPPLFFWILAPSMALLGPTALAGAIPSILGWLLLGYATSRLARAADLPVQAVAWGPVLVMTALLPALLTGFCRMDLLFAAWCTLALERLVRLAGHGDRRDHLLLWVWIGLGVLTKGPLILAFLFLPPFLQGRRGLTLLGRAFRGPGPLLGLAMVAAWLVPAGLTGGREWVETVVIHQSAGRTVASFAHREPWWYHLAVVPLTLLPWSILVLPGMVAVSAQPHALSRGGRLLPTHFLVGILFLSLLSGKTLLYPLPLFPAACLVAVWWLLRNPAGGVQRAAVAGAALVLLLVAAGLATAVAPRPDVRLDTASTIVLAASLALPALVGLWLAFRRLTGRAAGALAVAVPLFVVLGLTQLIGPANRLLSLAPIGEAYNRIDPPGNGDGLVWSHLNPGYIFHTGRHFRLLTEPSALEAALEAGRGIVIGVKDARRLRDATGLTWEVSARLPYRHTEILVITAPPLSGP